ncbi:hypothetical protein KY284_007722 [Solanum tuberosum]|nr:hypothetical protein KY284_007722 [Solanum tuberosum]
MGKELGAGEVVASIVGGHGEDVSVKQTSLGRRFGEEEEAFRKGESSGKDHSFVLGRNAGF